MSDVWHKPCRNGWPKKTVDKPYDDLQGRLKFMPRRETPTGAFLLVLRRMMKED